MNLVCFDEPGGEPGERWRRVARSLAVCIFKAPADDVSRHPWDCRHWVKERYYKLDWDDVYSLVELLRSVVGPLSGSRFSQAEYEKMINEVLASEHSGYRFTSGRLGPIASKAEMQAIEKALATTKRAGLPTIHAQLDRALELLAEKPTPDSRNAMKEAISAVEGAAKLISKTQGKGLKGPLDELARLTGMHPALQEAFVKLYAFTSDDDSGIRHAMLDAPNVDEIDARFMVIACSAFVHFLIEKAERAGLLKAT